MLFSQEITCIYFIPCDLSEIREQLKTGTIIYLRSLNVNKTGGSFAIQLEGRLELNPDGMLPYYCWWLSHFKISNDDRRKFIRYCDKLLSTDLSNIRLQ